MTQHHPRPQANDVIWVSEAPPAQAAAGHPAGADVSDIHTIGELAQEFGVTLRALRFYENKGLLSPRRQGMARLYSARDRARLSLILKGKRLGFTLGEIRDMIALSEGSIDSPPLNLSREKCLEQINLLERQKRELEAALAELRRIYSSFYSGSDSDLPAL